MRVQYNGYYISLPRLRFRFDSEYPLKKIKKQKLENRVWDLRKEVHIFDYIKK